MKFPCWAPFVCFPCAAHIPLYLYGFLHTSSKARPFEYLRLTSLGVVGALVKVGTVYSLLFFLSISHINCQKKKNIRKTVAKICIMFVQCPIVRVVWYPKESKHDFVAVKCFVKPPQQSRVPGTCSFAVQWGGGGGEEEGCTLRHGIQIQWKPFWLAIQLYPEWAGTGWWFLVNYDVCSDKICFRQDLSCHDSAGLYMAIEKKATHFMYVDLTNLALREWHQHFSTNQNERQNLDRHQPRRLDKGIDWCWSVGVILEAQGLSSVRT